MLSWWKLWWVPLAVFLLPVISVLIPQVEIGNKTVGGGYMREQIINAILPYVGDDIKAVVIKLFSESIRGEYVVYEWLAVNLGFVLAWLTFILISWFMSFVNWQKKESFKKEQQLLRK